MSLVKYLSAIGTKKTKVKMLLRNFFALIFGFVILPVSVMAAGDPNKDGKTRVKQIVDKMTLQQKVEQMIMPAIRSWNGKDVMNLSEFPELAEALRRHQYGGLILFGQNIDDTEQTVRLVNDLQVNNAQGAEAKKANVIPYMISTDQEGGLVSRVFMGTRGTGSMAIGATGDKAEENAFATGQIFGEELAALGINVNLGPCVDVINDMADPGMSTRVFSDDPQVVGKLGLVFKRGVDKSGVITTYKHFPGAGDGSDDPTSIKLTFDQLKAGGLSSYATAIKNGAEMIMTSAVTFPLIDDEQLMADGKTKGYYPATLSPKIVTKMLREEYGFDGVVITDALEMEQFVTEPDNKQALFVGEKATVEHDLKVAEKAINAGCDILLIPTDLNKKECVQYYDDYISGIVKLVEEGKICKERIDESILRILMLKEHHGILDTDTTGKDVDKKIGEALKIVGSPEHHDIEEKIAQQCVTQLKNDGITPLSGQKKRIVIIGRTNLDDTPIRYALDQIIAAGKLDKNVRIEDRISGKNEGDEKANTTIVIDRYYNAGELVYTDDLTASIKEADVVICLSAVYDLEQIQDDCPIMQGIRRALSDAHKAGAKFILLSNSLPVDTIHFQDADAIVCSYLAVGFGIDPTAHTKGSENVGSFNANVPAALGAIFGVSDMSGKLPINIPMLEKNSEGKWEFSDKVLYKRGF